MRCGGCELADVRHAVRVARGSEGKRALSCGQNVSSLVQGFWQASPAIHNDEHTPCSTPFIEMMLGRLINSSVAVEVKLEWALDWDTDVVGLFGGQLGQLHSELLEVEGGDLFVELPHHY